MAGYLCSVCGLVSVAVNGCGCLPALPALPDYSGLAPADVGRAVLLDVMARTDHVWSVRLEDLEFADHYSVSVIGGLGGREADPIVLRRVADARGAIMRAIDVKRSAARAEAKRARAALEGAASAGSGGSGGGGGARVLRPVGPSTRPPGGVGALPAPVADDAVSSASSWSF